MTDPAPPAASRGSGRASDRTLRGATITIAVVSLGLSGAFTYQAAKSFDATAPATGAAQPSAPPVSRESDDESLPRSSAPPVAAAGGQPVAVSGGS